MPVRADAASVAKSGAPKPSAGGFQIAKEAWLLTCARYPNLSGADMAVAVAISRYVNSSSRIAWPSLARLAEDTTRSRSTISRAIKRLELFCLIEIVHARGRHKSNRYRPKYGEMDFDPATLKRKTTARGKMLRTRTNEDANSHLKGCELAARTLDQPHTKCRDRDSQEETSF